MYAEPESVVIEVIDRLLVTQITARPLTAQEIRERGLVFDSSSFQAYNFTAAFAVANGKEIIIDFPIILPNVADVADPRLSAATLPNIKPPGLRSLATIIPDTLEIQSQVPNLSVRGFILTVKDPKGKAFGVPAIPGVVVIPGDIGFLNQVFSVLLMVGNVAPDGSKLVVSDATAEIVLPPGNDRVVLSGDDPLRMGRTAAGETLRVQPITQPGNDNKLGTGDDLETIGPGQTGNAEFIVEGLREGTHIIEMEIAATLNGLPIGPVEIRGRAAGSVLVRNPRFTLTFAHPEVVNAGEPYTLDVTVTNTSESPANFVSVNLNAGNLVGATMTGSPTQLIDSIAPGDAATVTYDLVALLTGKITAATLDSDGNIAGRFELKTAIGEFGVPLSPDALVLPKEANSLPVELRKAAVGLLGRAYAVATAPPAAVPAGVKRFSKKIIWDHGVEVAEAGMRRSLHEPLADTAAHLWMDFAGNNYVRLSERVKKAKDLPFEQEDYRNFDELRRLSFRGDVFADAVGALLREPFTAAGTSSFHQQLAEKTLFRPGYVSVLLGANGGPLSATVAVRDAMGRRLGGAPVDGRIKKEIPFSDFLTIKNEQGTPIAHLALIATPEPGSFTIDINRHPTAGPLTLSIISPDGSGGLKQVAFEGFTNDIPTIPDGAGDPYHFDVRVSASGTPVTGAPRMPSRSAAIADFAPTVLGVVQQKYADALYCDEAVLGYPGRIIAVLFSEEVTKESVQEGRVAADITNFLPDGNAVVSVALQPGRRIAYLALRDPVGPFVPRTITIAGVADRSGHVMGAQTSPIEATVTDPAGVVAGRVLQADGTPVPFANVRLIYFYVCGGQLMPFGISSRNTDADARYSWDYVLQSPVYVKVAAIDPAVDQPRSVTFDVQRNAQRLNVDLVFLGRGTVTGRTLRPDGVTPAPGTVVRAHSLTDGSQYGAISDQDGRFTLLNVPIGNLALAGVNVAAKLEGFVSEFMPFPGARVTRDFILFSVADGAPITRGTVRGHVLRADGQTVAPGATVVLYYQNGSQSGLTCGDLERIRECPVAVAEAGNDGEFVFADAPAGLHRVHAFDQGALADGNALATLTSGGDVAVSILLSGGLGSVRGVVLDAAGKPVPGASVGGAFSIVTTDDQGRFLLPDVPLGARAIVAVSEALRTTGSATVHLTVPGAEVNVTVVLSPTASIAGRVTERTGAPVPDNKVYLFRHIETKEGEPPKIEVIAQTVTNADGHYGIDNIVIPDRTRPLYVSAFRTDFSDGNVTPVTLRYQGQLFRADIVFKGGAKGVVRGRVFDDDGVTPVPARVAISGEQPSIAGGLVGTGFQQVSHFNVVDTDFSTGQYSFSGVWAGRFVVTAIGEFSPDPISAEGQMPAGGATLEVNLRLTPTGKITGTVLQPDGVTPVGAGVIVDFRSDAFKIVCSDSGFGDTTCVRIPQGIQSERVVTEQDGRFIIPIANVGPFTLKVEDAATGKVAEFKSELKPGQTPDVRIRLLGRGNLTINVVSSDGHTVIPDAEVVVTQVGFPGREITVRANSEGTVRLIGANAFHEGDVTVIATDMRNGFVGRAAKKIVQDGEEVIIPVRLFDEAGTVTGTVYAPDGLTPVSTAEVVLSNDLGPLAFAVTNQDGIYRIEQIPRGDFTLDSFSAANARRGYASGRVDLHQQEVPVNIVQLGMGLVKGRVLRAGDLQPLVNWQVSLTQRSPNGRSLGTLTTLTGLDGEYSFPGVSEGQVSVHASSDETPGAGSTTAKLTRDGQILELPIVVSIARPVFGRIAGTILDADLTPASFSTIDIRTGQHKFLATAAADGSFSIDQVPIGRYSVVAYAQATLNTGVAFGEIQFEGETDTLLLTLVGLSEVTGVVEYAGGGPARNINVTFDGDPASGCFIVCNPATDMFCPLTGRRPVACSAFTSDDGRFTFSNVPARTYSIVARDTVNNLTTAAGGVLTPGHPANLRLVLEPSAVITGRVLRADTSLASGAAIEILLPPIEVGDDPRGFYTRAGPDGAFRFEGIPIASYSMTVTDPLGTGIARRFGSLTSAVSLGDIVLDESAPTVKTVSPLAGAVQVLRNTSIRVTFSEPILPGTVTPSTVVVSSAAGPVTGTLQVSDNDTVVTFTPLALLTDQTRYSVAVTDVRDRLDKVIAGGFSSSFTTVDITPPSIVDLTPVPATNGVTIYTTIRVKYSEPIDRVKLGDAPIRLTGQKGDIAGTTDYIFGNTVVVFTPARPLDEDQAYTVTLKQAFDLSGLAGAIPPSFSFTTTDRTPPQLVGLSASNGGRVITNSVITITADAGTASDVALVDFFVNGTFASTARLAPFTLTLQAIHALGVPGDQIRIEAYGVDTSGNRSVSPVHTLVTIVADLAPGVVIQAPADGATFKNGDRVEVTVVASDDLGVTRLGYRAATGKPQDVETRSYQPPPLTQSQVFGFMVPLDAAPGSTILIEATGVDTKGEQKVAVPVSITVLDSVRPVVQITGVSTGERVLPGQTATAVVSASDLGSIASISFRTSGLLTVTETRQISPARSPVLASFTFTVPANAHPGESVRLDATATDRAGNVASAAQVIVPVADTVPPIVALRTESGRLDVAIGQVITVLADAEDEIAVSRVQLSGSGAFVVSDARQVTPPAGSATVPFTITIPATAVPGSVLTLTARATDTSNNVGFPATLALTIRAVVDVTLPPSALLLAGETQQLAVSVPAGAPAGGLSIQLSSDAPQVATVPAVVTLPTGETTAAFTITGVSGGTATISASVQGVPRATMVAVIRGGIVRGTVLDPAGQPVADANVTITTSDRAFNIPAHALFTVTDADGRYFIELANNVDITVRAFDPVTKLMGYRTGRLNRANGFVTLDVSLIAAGSIHGTVRRPVEDSPASAGARVDLFGIGNPFNPIATTFADDEGHYEFPLVPIGEYRLDASDVAGHRGRSNATLSQSGQDLEVPITYLATGSVTGVVRDGAGLFVPNATLRFNSSSIFGFGAPIVKNANPDGTFTFENVPAGQFTVTASDDATDRAGSASGQIRSQDEVAAVTISLAQWGALAGVVYRQDGLTPVAFAEVSARGVATTTDAEGRYTLTLLPLGPYHLTVREPSTNGLGLVKGSLVLHGVTETVDVRLFDQGSALVTVVSATGEPVPNAVVMLSVTNGLVGDLLGGTTGGDGTVLIQRVLAGDIEVVAVANNLAGKTAGHIAANVVEPITVTLEPTASIAGRVYQPDGQNPVTGGTILIKGQSQVYPIDSDGRYRIDGLQLHEYDVIALDTRNRGRQKVRVQLTTGGEVKQVDLTFIALGTVTGRVVNPEVSSASSLWVSLASPHQVLGGFYSGITDAAGFYEIENVPAGTFVIDVADGARALRGEGAGEITLDGEVVNVDVLLIANAVTLPVVRHDANGFGFDVRATGASRGSRLAVTVGDITTEFAGLAVGRAEGAGREIVVRQPNLAGLDVTRKVFVPVGGYFARSLEIVTNPTGAPVTVQLRATSEVPPLAPPPTGVFATSSGDAVLDVAGGEARDHWVVIDDDTDADPFLQANLPATALVFDSAGAGSPATSAMFSTDGSGRVEYAWPAVTLAPGASVAYLHFGVQQLGRAAAVAAASRLVQLPPEALAGLSPDEMQWIQNFTLPAEGVSALAPLPSLVGTVTGRTLSGDGSQPIRDVPFTFRSNSALFGRTFALSSDAAGDFRIEGVLADGNSVTVSIGDTFVLRASHPATGVAAPPVTGAFPEFGSEAFSDIVFSNTGSVRGVVRRFSGGVATSGAVTISSASPPFSHATSIAGDGSFAFSGLPGGDYVLAADVPHPQGTALIGSGAATIVVAQTSEAEVTLQPTGGVEGTVRTSTGAPAASIEVRLSTPTHLYSTTTDTSGRYGFANVPAETFAATAVTDNPAVLARATVSVAAGEVTTLDLALRENHPPVANAGSDRIVTRGATVQLDGIASSDPDSDPLTYAWAIVQRPSGSGATLSDATSPSPTFVADRGGVYLIRLIVRDGLVDSVPAIVQMTTENATPTANAGEDRAVTLGATVPLSAAASTDPDGDPLTYAWTLTSPAGSLAVLSDAAAQFPTFVADVAGTYTVTLVVRDWGAVSAPAIVRIATGNSRPVANAGQDRLVTPRRVVQLSAAASTDADGDGLTYLWSLFRPAGSNAVLSDRFASNPTFVPDVRGAFVVTLTVNDGTIDSAPATVTITTRNTAPVANAGRNQLATVGQTVALDGSRSVDVDGDRLSYQWTLIFHPSESHAVLADGSTPRPRFNLDVPGTYLARLIVSDGELEHASVMVVATGNVPAFADAGVGQTVAVGAEATLDGRASGDANGDALTYRWSFVSRPELSVATLSDAESATPRFVADVAGTYVLSLVVTDGSIDSPPAIVEVSTVNSRPIADAGDEQQTAMNMFVTLDGTRSFDPDGQTLNYLWMPLFAPPASAQSGLSDTTSPNPTVFIDRRGTYVYQLIASDGITESTPVTVIVTSENRAPVATATADEAAIVGQTVRLNGHGFDADNDPLTFLWSLEKPAGSAALLSDPSAQLTEFTPDVAGMYVARLVVNDGFTNSAPAPVAIAARALGRLSLTPAAIELETLSTRVFTVTLDAPARAGGQIVQLRSSDPQVVSLPSAVTFPAGWDAMSVTIETLERAGSVTLTASATDFVSATATVTVALRSAGLALEGTLAVGRGAELLLTTQTSAPPSGVTFTLTTDVPNVVQLERSTVPFTSGQTFTRIRVTGLTAATTTVKASAPGYHDATLLVDVTANVINLPESIAVTIGQAQEVLVSIAPNPAPAAGITVNLASSDHTVVQFDAPSVVIAAGATTATAMLRGIAPGTATLQATSAGFGEISAPVTSTGALNIVQTSLSFGEREVATMTVRLEGLGVPVSASGPGYQFTILSSNAACVSAPALHAIPGGRSAIDLVLIYGGSAPLPCSATLSVSGSFVTADSIHVTVDPAGSPIFNTTGPGTAMISYFNPAPVAGVTVPRAALAGVSFFSPPTDAPPAETPSTRSAIGRVSFFNPEPVAPPPGAPVIRSAAAAVTFANGPNPVPPNAAISVRAALGAATFASGPTILAIAPGQLSKATAAGQVLVITGANLQGATSVQIGDNSGLTFAGLTASADGTSLEVTVFVAPAAAVGTWTVTVTGLSGTSPISPATFIEIVP